MEAAGAVNTDLTPERIAELRQLVATGGIVDNTDAATGEVYRTINVCPWGDIAALLAERERLREALRACIHWVASSRRGAAQEALALACPLVCFDPFDWTSHPDVLVARMKVLGMSDRREEGASGD